MSSSGRDHDVKEEITRELVKNREVLSWHGIPQSIAAVLLEQSKQGRMCAVRGNEENRPASQLYLRQAADAKIRPFFPKPGTVKAKTGNRFPTNGVISEDIVLSKAVLGADEKWHIKERKKTDLPSSVIQGQHEVLLQEIIDRIASKECILLSSAQELRLGLIKFKNVAADSADEAKHIEFAVQVSSDHLQQVKRLEDAKGLVGLSDFKDVAQQYYPLTYQKPGNSHFDKVMIYGFPSQSDSKGFLPITGDIDMLIMGFDADIVIKLTKTDAKSAAEPVEMYQKNKETGKVELSVEKVSELIAKRVSLEVELFKEKYRNEHKRKEPPMQLVLDEVSKIIKGIDNASIATQGNVSPLESLMINQSNALFKKSVGELFQHGAESRNPFGQEELGKSVFFLDGEVHVVDGPKQTADLLIKALDKKITFDINPNWDMKYFGPVVQRQMAIEAAGGPVVLSSVREKFKEYARSQPRGVVVGAAGVDALGQLKERIASKQSQMENLAKVKLQYSQSAQAESAAGSQAKVDDKDVKSTAPKFKK